MSTKLTFAQEKALAHIREYGSLTASNGFKVTTVNRLRELKLVEMTFSQSTVRGRRSGRAYVRTGWMARLPQPVPDPGPVKEVVLPSIEWLGEVQFEHALTRFLATASPSDVVVGVQHAAQWIEGESGSQMSWRLDPVQTGNALSVFRRSAGDLAVRLQAAQRRIAELEGSK